MLAGIAGAAFATWWWRRRAATRRNLTSAGETGHVIYTNTPRATGAEGIL
jgi:hypothetical protein